MRKQIQVSSCIRKTNLNNDRMKALLNQTALQRTIFNDVSHLSPDASATMSAFNLRADYTQNSDTLKKKNSRKPANDDSTTYHNYIKKKLNTQIMMRLTQMSNLPKPDGKVFDLMKKN